MPEASQLSIWDSVHFGLDEAGTVVGGELTERMVLIAGEPGSGKSVALKLLVGHAALSTDCRLAWWMASASSWAPGVSAPTRSSARVSMTIDALRSLRAGMDDRTRSCSTPAGRLMFLRTPCGPVGRTGFRSRVWKPAVRAAGLPDHLRFHDLRHSYATWLVSDGVPPNIVQRIMGHEDVTTTLGICTDIPAE
jgi:hypothetical protein